MTMTTTFCQVLDLPQLEQVCCNSSSYFPNICVGNTAVARGQTQHTVIVENKHK